jgi:hypothetical protein
MKGKKMNVILAILLMLSGTLLFPHASAVNPLTVQTNPSSVSYTYPAKGPGSSFYVNITVSNAVQLFSYQSGFTFNKTALQVTNVTAGDFLIKPGMVPGSDYLAFAGKINNTAGIVTNYVVTLLNPLLNQTGSGTLFKVGFKVNPALAPPYTGAYPGSAVSMMHFNITTTDPAALILTDASGTLVTPDYGHITDGAFTLAVTPHGPTAALTVTPASVPLGMAQTLNASGSTQGWNGYANVPIDWYYFRFGDGNTLNQSNAVATHTYAAPGTYIANVTVHAGVTGSNSHTATATVLPPALSVTISPTTVTMDVGQSQLFVSNVIGGVWPYYYQWYLNGVAVSGATSSSWTFAPSGSGAFSVFVNVTDSASQRAKSNIASVTVHTTPSVSVSPSSATITLGHSQMYTSSVSGGTSPYSYQWYLNGSAVSGATSSSWTFTPASTGTYEIYVNITDAVGVIAHSTNAQLKVNPPPVVAVSISQSKSVIDVGQSVVFNSAVTGGMPPYTYQWYLNGSAVAGAKYSTWTFVPSSAGAYSVFLKVKDFTGLLGESNNATVIVNPTLGALVSPATVTLDIGEPWTFIASVFNGTPPYLSYQWYIDGSAVINATGTTWAFTPYVLANKAVYMTVTDSAGVTSQSNTVTVTVSVAMSPTISPLSVVMDMGQSQLYVVSVSGGTPPYSYQWYQWFPNGSTPFTGANKASFDFTPSFAGLNLVYVEITDSLGAKVDIGAKATVNPLLSVSISPDSVMMDVGQSQPFSSSVSGGTLPYSYQWYLNGSAVSGATSSSWTFTPTREGTYKIYVNTTDVLGMFAVSNTATVIANPSPVIIVSPAAVTLDIGEPWTFIASVFNGTPPYSSYQWYIDGSPVTGATNHTWTYKPLILLTHVVYVAVTDHAGFEFTSNTVTVTVTAAMNPTISPSSATLDYGQSQEYTVTVSGGAAPYSYQWYQWFPDGCRPFIGETHPTITLTPPIGFNVIYVEITDSNGAKVDWGAIANVNPQPAVSISPNSAIIDVGMSQPFTSIVVNGTQPYTYEWYIDNVPSATGSVWIYTATLASVGNHTVHLAVTDAVGVMVLSNNATITVNPPLAVAISPKSAATDLGLSVSFTLSITGGMTPYSSQWYVNGIPTGATGTTFTIQPTSTGVYLVSSMVTDAFGFTASINASVTINPVPTVTVSPTSVSINLGQHQTFTATVIGGTPPYHYKWYVGGVLMVETTNNTFTFTPPSISMYYELYVEITDAPGLNATSNTAIINGHDVGVTKVVPTNNAPKRLLKTVFGRGLPIGINVTVANVGYYAETFNVTAYVNAIAIASQTVTLLSGQTTVIALVGTTPNLAYGQYAISAYAVAVTGEVNTANNFLTNNTNKITVTIPGDINGDGIVNLLDLNYITFNWLKTVPPAPANADLNGDGVINLLDLNYVAFNWQKTA